MKRILVLLVMLSAAAAVFANGSQEADDEGIVKLVPGQQSMNSVFDGKNEVTLKGVIKYESAWPELTSGGKDYNLTAPGAQMFARYLSEGEKITVTGYIVDSDSMPFARDGYGSMMSRGFTAKDTEARTTNKILFVKTAEIDGTVYQMPWVDNEYAGMGFMGGRSRFGGHMGGYTGCPYYN